MAALNVSINQLSLVGFDATVPPFSAPQPIVGYAGEPFYAHATAAGSGQVIITVNQLGPNQYDAPAGNVQMVNIVYQGSSGPQTITYLPPSGTFAYHGGPLALSLQFDFPMQNATFVIDETAAATSAPGANDTPMIGIVILMPKVTNAAPTGYFVNVPLVGVDPVDATTYTTAKISWPQPGSTSGPIGGMTVP